MKRLLAAAALAALILPAPAGAQEKAPIWSGFYVGAHGGYAGAGDWGTDLSGTIGELVYTDRFEGDTGLSQSDGWHGGLQAGANYQFGTLVVGIEGDVSWTDLDASGVFVSTGFGAGPGGCLVGQNCTRWDIESQLEMFGTLRGRLGFVAGPLLIYGTGGLAWGIVDTKQSTTHNPGGNEVDGAITSGDSNHIGYALGGGGEFMVTQNVTIKAEYLYVDLGSADYRLTGTQSPTNPAPWTETFKQDLDFHTFRLGVNYKFD